VVSSAAALLAAKHDQLRVVFQNYPGSSLGSWTPDYPAPSARTSGRRSQRRRGAGAGLRRRTQRACGDPGGV